MTKEDFNDFLGKNRKRSKDTGSGLSQRLFSLPPDQRRMVNWLKRQGRCTLTEIADYLNQEETVVAEMLSTLEAEGILQQQGEDYLISSSNIPQSRPADQFYQSLTEEE